MTGCKTIDGVEPVVGQSLRIPLGDAGIEHGIYRVSVGSYSEPGSEGAQLKEGDTVLLKDQIDPRFNGVFKIGPAVKLPETG